MPPRQPPTSESPAISQYWDTDEVPDYIALLLAGFREKNPDFRHRVFNEAETTRFIADRFGPREEAAFRACAVPSMQSDYFRYCVVYALGGIYVDADHCCRRPLGPLLEDVTGGEIFLSPTTSYIRGRDARRVWSSLLAFRRPGHPFPGLALEIATANMEARIAERVWAPGENARTAIWLTVGPGVPSLMLFIRNLGSFDSFLEWIAGTPAEPFGPLYCEVIGSYERLVDAFDDVRVSPHERMDHWVGHPDEASLPYKQTPVHWQNVTTSIFR